MKIISIAGIIGWDVTEQGVKDQLAEANGEDVTFEVSSPGGFIAPGLGIFNAIRNYPGNVTAKLVGYAMSMASYIPLAVKMNVHNPGKVIAEDNAVYMIHNARGGSWGDHNDIMKYGTYLKGLSGVIAKTYCTITGKKSDEVCKMMDEETYFFGDEMVTHGFVDEIITTGKEDDKASATVTAQAMFSDAFARMSKDSMTMCNDIAMAYTMACAQPIAVQPPEAPGNNPQEVQQMKLHELLAANPDAQAEYNTAIAAAKAGGVAEMSAMVAKVAPILASTEYPEIVKTTALNVLKGEEAIGTLTAAVTAVDAVRQHQATTAAAAATAAAGETPAQQQETVDPTKAVSTQADIDAACAQMKGEV